MTTPYQCDLSKKFSAGQYPSVVDGQCTYTDAFLADNLNGGNTCNVTPWVFVYRYCPCDPPDWETTKGPITTTAQPRRTTTGNPGSVGDPHLTNIRGETFDVMREGIQSFLRYPATPADGQPLSLSVDAEIRHAGSGSRCNAFYLFSVRITGELVGEDIVAYTHGWDLGGSMAIVVKIGERQFTDSEKLNAFTPPNSMYNISINDRRKEMLSEYPHDRVKFAHLTLGLKGVTLEVQWATGGKRPNALDFRAAHLLTVGRDWGGLLGSDDHSFVSTSTDKCKKVRSKQQLLGRVSPVEPSVVSADLD